MDEHVPGRGQSDIESGEQGPRVGPSLQRRVRSLGIPFSQRWEGGFKEQIERCAKAWLVDGGTYFCDLQGGKVNFTNSKTLVGWLVSRPTVTRVTLDLPECQELINLKNIKK